MNYRKILLLLLYTAILTLVLPACTVSVDATPTAPTSDEPHTLKVMTHDSFAISEEMRVAFETENNVTLQFLLAGNVGTALNKAILSKGAPLGDVFYGVDNTYLSRALDEGIFESYESPLLADIPAEFQIDPEHRALPVDFGDVCLNYDKAYFTENSLNPPQSLEDLLLPEYKSLLVVENPAMSSPGLAFLLATIGHFGEDGYLEFWEGLVANDVLVVNDWETAYYTEFSGSSGDGPRPLVVSYGSSPPIEVIYAEVPPAEPPTAAIVADDTCFRQIEFVGILQGTPNRDLAEKWVDFMLSTAFQEDMPLQMYVFPVNPAAQIDPTFEQYLAIPERTAFVTPADITTNRERWINEWTDTVLR